nr:unnamed protein product [Callosobruchus analis]CAI5838798.1 unnamed protein product [Callosobruchus analis]CAI5845870.1 unnamed protein product [Callosobruchus analis]CAI5850024.1 unnamed protein product [Callosobruchus analis]CAI5853108.1 unnamed protein product [Callosobruchus analis]
MSEEEKKKIREQLKQMRSKMRKESEKRKDHEMDDYINGTQRTIYYIDKEIEVTQKAKNRQLAEENKKMAEEQNSRKRFLEKVVYANIPSDEFMINSINRLDKNIVFCLEKTNS